eukprot:Skav209370  [mRNA]  locus=scaffold64:35222:39959:+ [translate_table: standard]
MTFYEQEYSSVFIGGNGCLDLPVLVSVAETQSYRLPDLRHSLGEPDAHFSRPGFSALAHDLAPQRAQSTVHLEVEQVDLLDTRVLFLVTNQLMVSYQQISDAAAAAVPAIGVLTGVYATQARMDECVPTVCGNGLRETGEECDWDC